MARLPRPEARSVSSAQTITSRPAWDRINPINNPDGLVSNWCGPTLVAKLWFALN